MKFKKFILGIFVMSLIVVTCPGRGISANTETQESESSKSSRYITLTDAKLQNPSLFDAIKKAQNYFVMDGPYLILSEDINDIAIKEGLNENQIVQLTEMIELQHKSYDYRDFQPRVSIYHQYVCLTYGDLIDYFGVAASVSVSAVVAVMTAIGSIYPGVGTIAGAIVGIWGGKEIVANVVLAMGKHQGIAFSVVPPEITLFKGDHPGNG